MSELRIIGAPSRYLQGAGALGHLGELVGQLGSVPFLVADEMVMDLLGSDVLRQLEEAGFPAVHETFLGECTAGEIDRLAVLSKQAGCDVVIGLGGGKAVDSAKGVRKANLLPIIVVPTIASNDAPTSRLIVVYTEDHEIAEVRLMDRNPDVVLVDTQVISKAPSRFLRAGIGDALSKKFEAAQCFASGGLNFYGGRTTQSALALTDACYETLRGHAVAALQATENGKVDEHLEYVVEASILMSGIGFESGGLSLAHALTRGFAACPQSARALHGEIVAFGLLVQLIVEGRDRDFMRDMFQFYEAVDLPNSFFALGITNADAPTVSEIATRTIRDASYIKNLTVPIDHERLVSALLEADRMGRVGR